MTLAIDSLPSGWNNEIISPVTQDIGESWIKQIEFGTPQPFRFDTRLAGKTLG